MNGTNNPQVLALLNGAGKPAPEMTRGLSVLGDGSMADGLIALWENGQKNGIVKGTVVTSLAFTVGIGLYALAKNKIAEHKAKQAIKVACHTAETCEQPADREPSDEQCEAPSINSSVEVTA